MNPAELEVSRVVSVPFEENCFLVCSKGGGACFVVDPGLEPEKIIAHLEEFRLTPEAILNTHGHSDHIAGNGPIKQRWPDCRLIIGASDAPKLTDPQQNLSAAFGLGLVSPPADQTVADGETIEVAGVPLKVLEIPGHSRGHVVFVVEAHDPMIVFVGDVIFAGSIGRHDFPDGNLTDLVQGIREKLFTLPDDTLLLPGHGPSTTVGQEKRDNPFVGLGRGIHGDN